MNSNAQLLSAIADEYWQFLRQEQPISAMLAGQPCGTELLREAPEDHERRSERAKQFLLQLNAIDTGDLGIHERATAQLLRVELTLLRESFDLLGHLRPTLFPLGPDFALSYVANTVNLFSAADARLWLDRLASIPRGLEGIKRCLQLGIDAGIRYPRLALERAIENVRGLTCGDAAREVFQGPFKRVLDRFEDFDALASESLRIIDREVLPALVAYGQFIEKPLMSVARDTLACVDDSQGLAFYEHLIRRFANVDDSPQAIHELGLAEVARLQTEAQDIAAQAGFAGDLEGFRSELGRDPAQFAPTGAALREEIEILSKRIEAKLPALFGRLPRITYGVWSMPEATASQMPPAYAQPNPADNTAPGIHWVTPLPSKLPRYLHVPIALHEAWPGHLMHLALLQEQKHLPDFRRYGAFGYAACMEGWALYCEQLGTELGLYDTPQKRYGRVEMEIWRAVRLVVDTALHAKGWSREQAVDFASLHMAMPRKTIESEIDRYVAMPAQALAYQLGNLKMRELRQRAEQRLKDRFSLREFHDAVIGAGPVTLPVLESIIDEWIEAAAAKPC